MARARRRVVAALPFLAEHVEYHVSGPHADDDGEFEFGLDLILDGLARTLGAGAG